jgi:hypothetical protein
VSIWGCSTSKPDAGSRRGIHLAFTPSRRIGGGAIRPHVAREVTHGRQTFLAFEGDQQAPSIAIPIAETAKELKSTTDRLPSYVFFETDQARFEEGALGDVPVPHSRSEVAATWARALLLGRVWDRELSFLVTPHACGLRGRPGLSYPASGCGLEAVSATAWTNRADVAIKWRISPRGGGAPPAGRQSGPARGSNYPGGVVTTHAISTSHCNLTLNESVVHSRSVSGGQSTLCGTNDEYGRAGICRATRATCALDSQADRRRFLVSKTQ